ncbi:MBOAT family O-acyltransferase [Desulfospira joergensenii]|uniref:MBOAT family O-acyltransferase n=1 Tax=Desulfospira joergensenii TaxID=53329 RepID=UPI0003B4014B|nr:MBOAT family O-acyltransferase [Desulfospira joergensenii]
MLFNSYFFIIVFLPLALLVYLRLESSGKNKIRLVWLLSVSLFFYGWWNPVYLFLLIGSILINYLLGAILSGRYVELKRNSRFTILCIGVVFNLFLIGYFKYYNFFINSTNCIFNLEISNQTIILPLAISFYTFQQIAYLVDTFREETDNHNILEYSVFVSFFPQLIAGPIVHHKEVMPQLQKFQKRNTGLDLSVGITIFFIGLFKKVILADNFALLANPIFVTAEQGGILSFFQAWKGAFSYSLQLYFDFSGYSDMAIGLARMFGIYIPLNFFSPYKATGIIDFWRRWHITLSRFLKNYLYIPLGGNRRGIFRRYINILITMLLGGLWHGAGWTFVVWGGLHGIMLILNNIFRLIWKNPLQTFWAKTVSRFFTFVCVTCAWVFFRSETFGGAIEIFRGMLNLPHTLPGRIGPLEKILETIGFTFNGPGISLSDYLAIPWLFTWLCILWFWPNTSEWLGKYEPGLNSEKYTQINKSWLYYTKIQWQPIKIWGIVLSIIGLTSILNLSRPSEFLYFQF